MAKAQRVKFLKTNLSDQPGVLLKVMQELKDKKVSLKSLWGFSKQGADAELYVIAKDTDKIKNLWTTAGKTVEEGTTFFSKGTDKTGALLKDLQALADANVNIHGIHAIAVGGKYGSLLRIGAADVEKAAQALGAK